MVTMIRPPRAEELIPSDPQDRPIAVAARDVSKTYPGGSSPAVSGFTLDVFEGEVMALLGPSGCGKTTALRLLAGLERPDSGDIEIAGRIVSGRHWVPPERRSVGMVFQDYALFPHRTVAGNIGYGLNTLSRADRRSRIEQVLVLTGLTPLAGRYPHELSGGQQQRVAIARAIAPRPSVVLLDEPFSNLDVEMREQVRSEVMALLRAASVTVILVTHDQDEAFVAADRIAVMSEGRVHQVGTGEDLYDRPKTRFVAQFVGIANFVAAQPHNGALLTPFGELPAPAGGQATQFDALLRPEQIEMAADGLYATVIAREFHGHDWLYVMQTASGDLLRIIDSAHKPRDIGDTVRLRARMDGLPLFPANA